MWLYAVLACSVLSTLVWGRPKKRAVGWRKPGTEIGSWEGAMVIAQQPSVSLVHAAIFDDGRDYVAYFHTWPSAYIFSFMQCYREGFTQRMSEEDLLKTAGVD